LIPSFKSSIKIRNNTGPKTEPCEFHSELTSTEKIHLAHKLAVSCLPTNLQSNHATYHVHHIRGVWVYLYPPVYPTRPVPAGMGRVRVDVLRVGSGTGTKSTGTGIPVFTRKEHHFSRCWSYIECFFISSF